MMATVGGQPPGNSASGKLTKPRSRVVKPILKKLSHSEKNSLDLDRSWEDQPSPDSSSSHIWGHGWPGASDSLGYSSGARPARDVTFSLGTTDGVTSSSVRKYTHHARSTSGTSHHSHLSIATTSSGHRGGSFVHPFQQTPRTSTPPLGYANSLASFDNTRDYSPTITEDDDDLDPNRSAAVLYASQQSQGQTPLAARSQSNLRRPSLASRTSSLSDVNASQPVRVSTASRTSGKSISRLAHGLVSSRSDLNLNIPLATSTTDPILETSSPASVTSPASGIIAAAASASVVGSPTSSAAPMSPLRSSLDMAAFPRLRTNSEVSPATRAEIIRHERRKFAEKEDRKQKSWEQKMIRKREKDITREAVKKEQEATARARKNSSSNSRREILTSRSTGNLLGNSSSGRKKAKKVPYSARTSTDKTEAAFPDFEHTQYSSHDEKTAPLGDFQSRDYRTMPNAQSPKFAQGDEVHFIPTVRRRTTAKAKTHGAWTTFVLWMRTKLLRLSKSG